MGHVFEPLSYAVWGACIEVQRQLGPHCMEVDYQRALELALAKRGLEHIREAEIPITFDGVEVTRRRVDFVVWDDQETLILETKAASAVKPEDIETPEMLSSLPIRVPSLRSSCFASFTPLRDFVVHPSRPSRFVRFVQLRDFVIQRPLEAS